MSTSREKFERWLKHAERLEAELKERPEAPAPLGPPEAKPWSPRGADPFGVDWKWLDAEPKPPAPAAVVTPQLERAPQTASPSRLRLAGYLTALAATLLLGFFWGRQREQPIIGPPTRMLAMTDIEYAEIRIRDPLQGTNQVVRSISVPRAPLDGYLTVVAPTAAGETLMVPEGNSNIQTTVGAPVAIDELPASWNSAVGGVLIITEQPLNQAVRNSLSAAAQGPTVNLEQLQQTVEQVLAKSGIDRVAVGSVRFESD
jgi:hypothetical protein